MIANFFKRNCYSLLFMIFMVLNFNLLHIWFPIAMSKNLPLLVWVAVHIYLYFAYISPAEDKKNNGDKNP